MTLKELERIKDVAVDFANWMDEETIDLGLGKRLITDSNTTMEYPELFDYYVHTILTEIIIDDLDKDK